MATAEAAATRRVKARSAKLIVLLLLRWVGQDFIGGLDFLEFFAGVRFLAGVGMVLFGSCVVCLFDFGGGGSFRDAESCVGIFGGGVGGSCVEALRTAGLVWEESSGELERRRTRFWCSSGAEVGTM